MSRSTDELLAAYVDGVAELSLDERRRVEARLADDATVRADEAATRELLGALRELPHESTDWTALERSIRRAVADEPMPRAGWRRVLRGKWLVPGIAGLAAATAIAIVATRPARRQAAPAVPAGSAEEIAIATPPLAEVLPLETATSLWLDGAEVELDDAALDALEASELARAPSSGVESELGLLPTSDGWVDTIDDDALGAIEQWLDDEQLRQRKRT